MTDTKQRRSVQGIIALIEERYKQTMEVEKEKRTEVEVLRSRLNLFFDLKTEISLKYDRSREAFEDVKTDLDRICTSGHALRDILKELQAEEDSE